MSGHEINVRELLERGQAAQNAAHGAQEEAKRGVLRGGSAGCIGVDGLIYGECHRVALLRLLGVDKEVEFNKHAMFDAGRAAEDSWAAKLEAAGVCFRREEEIQITYPISGFEGRVATGRPDIVIGEYDYAKHPEPGTDTFEPKFGLELKGVYSAGTAVRVEVEGIPEPKHLAQAGFYSLALNIPYAICYTNPSVWDVPFWAKEARAAGHKKLQPFYRMFYLKWSFTEQGDMEAEQRLCYRDERNNTGKYTDWVITKYTKEGIVEFYRYVLALETAKTLGKRPDGGLADGSPAPFSKCKYCQFSPDCDMYDVDRDYDSWLESCKI